MSEVYYPDVTLLITHYNRSSSLERLLKTFREQEFVFGDIVVSDDGSKPEHLNRLNELKAVYAFRLITTPQNKGLGNNINKGQDAIKTPYTLYVQEDFVPHKAFKVHFRDAVKFMQDRSDLDMVRFYAYFKYPYLKPYKNGFSEMLFSPWPWYWGYKKFYYYSDHPHLRRSDFLDKFGRYKEGVNCEVAEYHMMMAFLRKKGKALFYQDFNALFEQKNTQEEPSTLKRNYWRESNHPLVALMRHVYRHVKFNFDLHFSK